MKTIDIIAGARPNFIKIAPIIHSLEKRRGSPNFQLNYRLVHTGQHYDKRMSGDFFTQLGIPLPDINLNVGSGTQAKQTAAIMVAYEELLLNSPSDLCLVVGDVNSTAACAIAAQKLCIPVAHVEAGIRAGDWSMPEEINRILTDSITNFFFTTSVYAGENLKNSGVHSKNIFFVGNTMIDTLMANMTKLRPPKFMLDQVYGEYFVLTLHRPSNVDDVEKLEILINAISEAARGVEVIFPVHPRTRSSLNAIDSVPANVTLVDPLPYLEFNYLVKNSKAVITDSGGVTEEATVMGVPCLTLRETTERPETVNQGTNVLVGSNPENIKPTFDLLFSGGWKTGVVPDLWDGNTSGRIVEILEKIFEDS